MPSESYDFSESYDRLAMAGISPLAVIQVLHGGQAVRRHIGSSLQVFGEDQTGAWIAVALIEIEDDRYQVYGARYMDDDEIAAVLEIRKWRRDDRDDEG